MAIRQKKRKMIDTSRLPSSTYHNISTNKPISYMIQAEVEFGRPSRGCDGVGICKIIVEPVVDQQGKKCKRTKVQLYKQDHFLVFHFKRADLCPCLFKKQFRRHYFLVDEPVGIPISVGETIGTLPGVIDPGQYSIELTKADLKIFINLRR